jgi:hypothetical protein
LELFRISLSPKEEADQKKLPEALVKNSVVRRTVSLCMQNDAPAFT